MATAVSLFMFDFLHIIRAAVALTGQIDVVKGFCKEGGAPSVAQIVRRHRTKALGETSCQSKRLTTQSWVTVALDRPDREKLHS